MEYFSKKPPQVTAEEYFKIIPETNQPTELLEGEIVALASPTPLHQNIAGMLYHALMTHIQNNKGACKPFIAPLDVKLTDDTVVQPDVLVVCDPDKITESRIEGAPDFVCEVVSTDRSRDFFQKLYLYKEGGVREYWIVDPMHKKSLVYFFEQSNFPDIYTFDTPIPVGIFGGEPKIRIADFL